MGCVYSKVDMTLCSKKSKITLDPKRAILNPGDHMQLFIRHDVPLRELIDIAVYCLHQNMVLYISGQVVNQKLFLLPVSGSGSLEQVDFSSLFYGQRKDMQAVLVKNGPAQVNYIVSYADEGDQEVPAERPIVVSPADSTL